MEKIVNYYQNLSNKVNNLINKRYFYEIYVAILMLISLLGFMYSTIVGLSILIIISFIMLIMTFDISVTIPVTTFILFVINSGFQNDEIPIVLIIFGIIYVLMLVIFSFKNGFKLKKMRSFYGLLGLAIMNIIPIFYSSHIPSENSILYFLFFLDLCYFLVYIIYVNGINKNSIKILSISMSYLCLLLSLECFVMVLRLKDTVENIFDLWYYMGWGLCNEAGIMICFSLPFIFYLMAKCDNKKMLIINNAKVIIALVGILLTTSRGSYIFGFIEIIGLYLIIIFNGKLKKEIKLMIIAQGIVAFILVIAFSGSIVDVVDTVFPKGLDNNGRINLFKEAIEVWKKDGLNIVFGGGYNAVLKTLTTAFGKQLAPQVFHSTFFETLAIGGIFGVIMLIVHFTEKYYNLYKMDKVFMIIIGFGYIIVDTYGMIDNTYHMYYYMIPLVITLSCIDTAIYYKNEDISEG